MAYDRIQFFSLVSKKLEKAAFKEQKGKCSECGKCLLAKGGGRLELLISEPIFPPPNDRVRPSLPPPHSLPRRLICCHRPRRTPHCTYTAPSFTNGHYPRLATGCTVAQIRVKPGRSSRPRRSAPIANFVGLAKLQKFARRAVSLL